jgi:hypothetical protein
MIVLCFDVGIKNLSFCIFNTNKKEILKWENVNIIDSDRKVNSYTIQKLLQKLFQKLDEFKFQSLNIDKVMIENQMIKNNKMKNIQIGLFSYFIFLKFEDVKLISAKKKISCFQNEIKEINIDDYKCKNSYNTRKKQAICLTKFFLKKYNLTNYFEFFKNSKKKDDLSDCFLYCITNI